MEEKCVVCGEEEGKDFQLHKRYEGTGILLCTNHLHIPNDALCAVVLKRLLDHMKEVFPDV